MRTSGLRAGAQTTYMAETLCGTVADFRARGERAKPVERGRKAMALRHFGAARDGRLLKIWSIASGVLPRSGGHEMQ